MYLVTATILSGTDPRECISEGRDDLPKAKDLAENWAKLKGYADVTIWLRTHTVEIVSEAKWQEHAKGLTGNGG